MTFCLATRFFLFRFRHCSVLDMQKDVNDQIIKYKCFFPQNSNKSIVAKYPKTLKCHPHIAVRIPTVLINCLNHNPCRTTTTSRFSKRNIAAVHRRATHYKTATTRLSATVWKAECHRLRISFILTTFCPWSLGTGYVYLFQTCGLRLNWTSKKMAPQPFMRSVITAWASSGFHL